MRLLQRWRSHLSDLKQRGYDYTTQQRLLLWELKLKRHEVVQVLLQTIITWQVWSEAVSLASAVKKILQNTTLTHSDASVLSQHQRVSKSEMRGVQVSIEIVNRLVIFQKENWARLFISLSSVTCLLLKSSEVSGLMLIHDESDIREIQIVTQLTCAH